MLLVRSPRYFAMVFSDIDNAFVVSFTIRAVLFPFTPVLGIASVVDRKVDRIVLFQVPDFTASL